MGFLNFLDEIKSDKKNSNVGKCAAGSVSDTAAGFRVITFLHGCENVGRVKSASWPASSYTESVRTIGVLLLVLY